MRERTLILSMLRPETKPCPPQTTPTPFFTSRPFHRLAPSPVMLFPSADSYTPTKPQLQCLLSQKAFPGSTWEGLVARVSAPPGPGVSTCGKGRGTLWLQGVTSGKSLPPLSLSFSHCEMRKVMEPVGSVLGGWREVTQAKSVFGTGRGTGLMLGETSIIIIMVPINCF